MPLLHYNQYRNCEEAELFFQLKDLGLFAQTYPILCLKPQHKFLQSSRLWNQWTAPVSAKNTQKHKFRHLVRLRPDVSLVPNIVRTSEKRPRVTLLRLNCMQSLLKSNRVHRAWKKRFRCLEASYRSEGSRKKNCTPVDYEVEWALYQQMKEDEKKGRVAEALYVPKPDEVPVTRRDGTQGRRKQELSEKDDAERARQCLVSVDTVEIHQIWWCQHNFASGFPRAEAALISQAERASDMWLGHDPPDWTHLSDMARRRRRDHLLLELREVLRILDGLAEDSDAEEFQDGRLVYEVESDGDD
ncbi:hypothetical protein B0H14DRAFT_2640156 [Mycena olivaceomarginata]|nr:hypothetical protein B0H14DRAFT_2640156 [Mycena olivaceomarginata]